MPVPQNANEFLDLLQRSSLIEAAQLERLCADNADLFLDEVTALECARQLVELKMITAYQARLLMSGRHKGFYVGKYKVLELLGRGGMGHVFLAEQVAMQRLVAIKVVNRPVSPESETYSRFIREARAIAALRHPNIIQAFDFDETSDGVPYIVMEYIEGLDVARQVRRFGPVPPQLAADYIHQAAEGLQHAHERGFVHRDIKPGNLLVDAAGVLRLLDLGLVSEAEQISEDGHLTSEDGYLGTLDYIAPEQAIDSRSADIRSDIYSLGVVFYFALSGQQLFPKCSAAQKLLFHQTKQPTSLHEISPQVPSELCDVVHRMIAKDPADRFQTPAEVQAAVASFVHRIIPPFDVRAIGYSRDRMDHYLRHSPSTAGLSSSGLSSGTGSNRLPVIGVSDDSSPGMGSHPSSIPEAELSDGSATGRVFVEAPLPSQLPRISDGEDDDDDSDEDSHFVYQTGSVIDAGYAEMPGVRDIPTFQSLQDDDSSGDPRRLKATGLIAAAIALVMCAGGWFWYSRGDVDEPGPGSDNGGLLAQSGAKQPDDISGRGTPAVEPGPAPEVDVPETPESSDPDTPRDPVEDPGSEPNPAATPIVETNDKPTTNPPPPFRPIRRTVLDSLSPADIAPYELSIATGSSADSLPELVAVFGDSRMTHWNSVTAVAWSPIGSRIASASNDRTIRYWDPENGEQIRLLHSGEPRTTALAFSRDGRKLAVGDADGFVAVWDVVSSRPIWREKLERGTPNAIAFSTDHRDLYVTCRAMWKLHVFDAAMGQLRDTASLGDAPWSMELSPDGTRVAIGLKNGAVLVRDPQNSSLVYRLDSHTSPVTEVRFSPESTHLMSVAKDDFQSVIWDLSDGSLSTTVEFSEPPHRSSFTTDASHILTATGWPLRFDDLNALDQPKVGYSHYGQTNALAMSPNRDWLVSGADDHHLRIWNARQPERKFDGSPTEWGLVGFSVSGDAQVLATGDQRTGRVWNVSDRTLRHNINGINGPMRACAVSPDGRLIAGGGGFDGQLMIWNADTLDRQHQIEIEGRLYSAAFSADSTRLAVTLLRRGSGLPVDSAWVYNPVTGEPVIELQSAADDSNGRSILFSPDGDTIAAAGIGSVVVWDAQAGEQRLQLTAPEIPPVEGEKRKTGTAAYFTAIAFTPDSSRLVASRRDGRVHLFDAQTGEHIRVLHAGTVPAESVAVSPDARTVAWALNEGCVCLLPLDELTAEPRRLQIGPPRGIIHQIQFGPDSRHLLTANGNGTVYVLRLQAAE